MKLEETSIECEHAIKRRQNYFGNFLHDNLSLIDNGAAIKSTSTGCKIRFVILKLKIDKFIVIGYN